MSIENVNQFYQVVLQDPALQLQFQFATDDQSLAKMAVAVAADQQHGYSFTAEEVMQAIALAQPPTETTGIVELADEQLEAVAGGKDALQNFKDVLNVGSYLSPIGLAVHAGAAAAGAIGASAAKAAGGDAAATFASIYNKAQI